MTFLGLSVATLAAQDIPIENPGFEAVMSGWRIPSQDGGMSRITSDAAKTGSYGAQVIDSSGAAGSSLESQKIAIRGGEGYRLSYDAKVVSGGGIGVYLLFFDSTGAKIQQDEPTVKSMREMWGWQRHELVCVAPAQAVELAVWVHSYRVSEVEAFFDNFAVEQIPASEAEKILKSQAGPEAPMFPKEDPEHEFSAYKVYQPDGSVLRTPVEDWEGARQRVANDPGWAQWLADREAEVTAWMDSHQDRAEWQGGWWHNFVSPVDGAFLVWTDEVPGEDVEYLMSRSGDQVAVTTDIFEGWVFGFRKRNFANMVEAARLYHLTGETRYADWVVEQLDFYADNYEGWGNNPRQRKGSHLGWQALEDATWLAKMVESARLVFDYVSEPERQYWYDHLFKPQADLLTGQGQYVHNIPMWFRSAAAQVALLYDDEDLWDTTINGPFGLRDQFEKGVTSDYFWYEQSMGYNSYIMMATYPLFVFAGLLDEGERLEPEAAILQNLMLAPYTLAFPDGRIPNPADASGPAKLTAGSLGRIYRVLPTWAGLDVAAGQRSWDTLIDPPEAVQGDASLPDVEPRLMESSRFAVIKDGPWQVFLHAGQLCRSHSQAEALNWSAYFGETLVSQDAGTVGYGSPLAKGYYSRGLAHNVPLIGGYGQQGWNPGEFLDYSMQPARIQAVQEQYRDGICAERTIAVVGNALVDEVSVTVAESGAAKPIGLALHLEGTPSVGGSFVSVPAAAFAEGRSSAFGYWQDVVSADFVGTAVVPVAFDGGLVLDVTFSYPGSFTLYIGDAPGQPPARHAAFYLETEAYGQATIRTTLVPAQVPETASLGE